MSTFQTWRKSSQSQPNDTCVELSVGVEQTGIRDTKNQDGGTLTVGTASFTGFLAAVKADELS